MTENQISYAIRGAIFEVYNQVGTGLLESVYQRALQFELINMGLMVQKEVPFPLRHNLPFLHFGRTFRTAMYFPNEVRKI